MNTNYVRGASITAAASQSEIQQMLMSSGATGLRWSREDGKAAIAFRAEPRRFRLVLALPHTADGLPPRVTAYATAKTPHDLSRQRWRQLSLLIRAKLDAVDSGIATFDEEFLGYMLDPEDGAYHLVPSTSWTRP
ncbi:hypothetical protein SCMU_05970 [Sinomonas cyclohexanicum]|uniref:Uncharacterized protein n=1 Tax=Sinomonas cyclohexanicum TaxID=322009 RepID=A0ABN6FED6_SINCY|nr:hypothetical protein [Corynebacterium cyclohexanicum]BCT74755.1 hypothetical protein SCMU_05970 [Corynebacterium cyclohexanicum]